MDERPREPSPTDSTADWWAYWQPHCQQIAQALNATPAGAHHWDLLQHLLHHGVRTGNPQYVASRIKHETPFEHAAKIISDLDHKHGPAWGTALLGILLSLISLGQGAGMLGTPSPPLPAAPKQARVVLVDVNPYSGRDADPPTPSEPDDLAPSTQSPRPTDELLHQSLMPDPREISPAMQEAIRQAANTPPIHFRQQSGDTSSP